jgi:hypothetical protein
LDGERAGAAGHLAVHHLVPRQPLAGERPVQRGEADDLVALRPPAVEQCLEQARELPPSSSACAVKTCGAPDAVAASRLATGSSSRPISSSSVGSVVGICTQPTASPFQSGTKGETPRVSEA